ncbi:MAG: fibrobacter succinogenes major paralogous domain-containing protein, partial [Dysgonamonadaceae bacterium]|nr:fibrobacter succinogenes major paralogous domain-containing protein [Dysgonamonadaceae bacterium]
ANSDWQYAQPKKHDGTQIYSSGVIYQGSYFPASGSRKADGGNIDQIGIKGLYWSSTPAQSANQAYALNFDKKSINPLAIFDRYTALPVRCVKNVE